MFTVIGISDSGPSSLSPELQQRIETAAVVLGGRRHLELLPPSNQDRRPWPTPLRAKLPALVQELRDQDVIVLASGDPLLSGIGTTLVTLLGLEHVSIHPTVSSESLARARMGWSAEETTVVTTVGRDLDRIRRHFAPGERLIVLSTGGATPAEVAALLTADGYGPSPVTVWSHLDSDREQCFSGTAADWPHDAIPNLNLVCCECRLEAGRQPHGLTTGLPDAVFDHDGQLTKQFVRAAALASLRPNPAELLWDIGAGAGSIAIEWARSHPHTRAIAVERDPVRAARARRNASQLGVPDQVQVRCGNASEMLSQLADESAPDAVFLGGGVTTENIETCWNALHPGGRIVAHAVTVETELTVLDAQTRWGGELTRIGIETVTPLGRYRGWQPARTVTHWAATKPGTTPPRPSTSALTSAFIAQVAALNEAGDS